MIDQKLVKEKLKRIEDYYEKLDELLQESLKDILGNFKSYFAIERAFILIIDEMIDINTHLIQKLDFKIPDDFQSTFIILGENDILPEDFAQKVAPVMGLRNRLVHRYEKIDRKMAIELIQKEKPDFRKYVKFIYQYLEKI